jgi:D-glycero-D-manno-heptose 1,7-bisphosphate phosphatase
MNKDKSQTNPKSKAVFLDRDGTICEDVNYLSRAEDLRIFPFAAEAIKLLNSSNFLVILITNQSGIARGYFDENALREIHEKLVSELASQGAMLDRIYFCPHNTGDNCNCRKPKTGMIELANEDFPIDLEMSWTIGDKVIDVELGFNTGTKTALVLTGYGRKEIENLMEKPDLVVENFWEAAKIICLRQN